MRRLLALHLCSAANAFAANAYGRHGSKRLRATRQLTRRAANMDTQFAVSGLGALADRYDVFLLDQYGVLHNGAKLLPGCADTLQRLHDLGKKLVVLSNTSKRRQALVDELPGRGFAAEWLHDAICSGEVCHEALRRDYAGQKAVVFGWSTRGSADYLQGTGVELAAVDEARLLVARGPGWQTGASASLQLEYERQMVSDKSIRPTRP